jgi:hypothetical protein
MADGLCDSSESDEEFELLIDRVTRLELKAIGPVRPVANMGQSSGFRIEKLLAQTNIEGRDGQFDSKRTERPHTITYPVRNY